MALRSSVYDTPPEEQSPNSSSSGRVASNSTGAGRASYTKSLPGSSIGKGNSSHTQSGDPDQLDPVRQAEAEGGTGLYNPSGDTAGGADGGRNGSPTSALRNSEESAADDDRLGEGYTEEPQKRRRRISGRTKAVAAGGTGGLIALVFGISTFGSGPLQLVHLSQILQKNFFGQEESAKIRTKGLYRYLKTGSIGETRLSYVGSKINQRLTKRLGEIGVEHTYNKVTGLVDKTSVDSDKLKEKVPELENRSPSEAKSILAKKLGISPDDISHIKGGQFEIKTTDYNLKQLRDYGSGVNQLLDDGKVQSWINNRVFAKFTGNPGILHPIEKAKRSLEKKVASSFGGRDKATSDAAEETRVEKTQGPIKTKSSAVRAKLQDELGPHADSIAKGLFGVTIVCAIRDAAGDVVNVNRAAIVIPAVGQVVDKIAVGSQVQSGKDITAQQVGDVTRSFTDKDGQSIWKSQALNATADPSHAVGEDLPKDYKQAFTNRTTAASIKDTIDNSLGGSFACSTPGQIANAVLSVGLLLATPLTGGGSLALYASKTAAEAAATSAVLLLLQNQLTSVLKSSDVVPKLFGGPLGGSLLAYAGREAGNMGSRAMGGVDLGSDGTAALDRQQQIADQQEFEHRPYFARMFDLHDYRSLTSRLADSVSAQNAQSTVLSVTNVFGALPHAFSSLIPKAAADTKPYDWGFNRSGIPAEVLNNSSMENSYDNGDKVASVLDGSDGQGYIQKAKTCFGANISKGDHGWQVVANGDDINPNSEEYQDANCADMGDSNWQRTMLFVFDSRNADAVDCFDGDSNDADTDQSCQNATANSQQGNQDDATTTDTQASETADASLDMAHLYDDSTNIQCADGTKDLGIQDGYHDNKKIKIRVCALNDVQETGTLIDIPGADGKLVVNSRLSAFYVKLVQDAKAAGVSGITAQEGFRTMARQTCLFEHRCGPVTTVASPGTSNHQMGLSGGLA